MYSRAHLLIVRDYDRFMETKPWVRLRDNQMIMWCGGHTPHVGYSEVPH